MPIAVGAVLQWIKELERGCEPTACQKAAALLPRHCHRLRTTFRSKASLPVVHLADNLLPQVLINGDLGGILGGVWRAPYYALYHLLAVVGGNDGGDESCELL